MGCRNVDPRKAMPALPWGDPIKKEQVTNDESGGERAPCWGSTPAIEGVGSGHTAEVGQRKHRATPPATLVPRMFQASNQAAEGTVSVTESQKLRLCPFRNPGVLGSANLF